MSDYDDYDDHEEKVPMKWDDVKRNTSTADMCKCTRGSYEKKEVVVSAALKFWVCSHCKKETSAPLDSTRWNNKREDVPF